MKSCNIRVLFSQAEVSLAPITSVFCAFEILGKGMVQAITILKDSVIA